MGRPGVVPGVYFRMQFVGYFEGIESERGIAWRCADALSLREFLGVGLSGRVPDYSSMSRTRRLINLETHAQVFGWMLGRLAGHGLIDGKTVGVDATTVKETLIQTSENMEKLANNPKTEAQIREDWLSEVVADKGYHSNETMVDLRELEIRSYISEPDRGRRRWTNKPEEQQAVYANRRRIGGRRGKELLRQRCMMLERPFAHGLETGAMRRVHLRGRENILKRFLVHYAALNLALMMRHQFGTGTPRSLQDGSAGCLAAQTVLFHTQAVLVAHHRAALFGTLISGTTRADISTVSENPTSTTGC